MLFQTRGDRFVPFDPCRVIALAWAVPAGDHRRALPAPRLSVLPCYRETAAAHDRARHPGAGDRRRLSLRELPQAPDKWRPDAVLSCCEWRECGRTDPPALHPAATD